MKDFWTLLISNMNPVRAVRVRVASSSETPPLQQMRVPANHIRIQQYRFLLVNLLKVGKVGVNLAMHWYQCFCTSGKAERLLLFCLE